MTHIPIINAVGRPISYRFSVFCLTVGLAIISLILLSWTEASARTKDRHNKSRIVQKKPILKKETIKKKNHKKKPSQAAQSVQAKAVYCVDLGKNETLLARNPDRKMPVASLTKLVTALVTLDHLTLDKRVAVPDDIKSTPKSVVGLKPGDRLTVEDLLHGLLIGSGNDCAETLAEAFPGGRKKFIAAMNQKARTLGAKQTVFYTPSGLDRKTTSTEEGKTSVEVDSNQSTAREIAQVARAAFENKTIREICMKKSHVIAGSDDESYTVRTTNKLLRDNLPLAGGKTGYTCRAGHCLASEFRPGRHAILIVVLGSPDHFKDTRLLYRKALKEATRITIPPAHRSADRIAAN